MTNRVISSPMPKFQPINAGSQSQGDYLMPQSDAENRFLSQQRAAGFHRIRNCLGISGPIGDKDSIRFQIENLFCRCCSRYCQHFAASSDQGVNYSPLGAQIHHDHFFTALPEFHNITAGHIANYITFQLLCRHLRLLYQPVLFIQTVGDNPPHSSLVAYNLGQSPGVNFSEHCDLTLIQEGDKVEFHFIMAGKIGGFPQYQPLDRSHLGSKTFLIKAHIAHQGISHYHYLAII